MSPVPPSDCIECKRRTNSENQCRRDRALATEMESMCYWVPGCRIIFVCSFVLIVSQCECDRIIIAWIQSKYTPLRRERRERLYVFRFGCYLLCATSYRWTSSCHLIGLLLKSLSAAWVPVITFSIWMRDGGTVLAANIIVYDWIYYMLVQFCVASLRSIETGEMIRPIPFSHVQHSMKRLN